MEPTRDSAAIGPEQGTNAVVLWIGRAQNGGRAPADGHGWEGGREGEGQRPPWGLRCPNHNARANETTFTIRSSVCAGRYCCTSPEHTERQPHVDTHTHNALATEPYDVPFLDASTCGISRYLAVACGGSTEFILLQHIDYGVRRSHCRLIP